MSPERAPGQFRLEEVVRLAKETALEHGGHVPTLIAQGSTGSAVGPLYDLPPTHEERCQWMFSAGVTLARSRQVGVLQRVFFVCEGWMSYAAEDGTIQALPSQDPNRIEVLFVSSFEVEGQQTDLVLFEMVRDEAGQLTELKQLEQPSAAAGGYVDSPLLSAFAAGFRRATGGEFNQT